MRRGKSHLRLIGTAAAVCAWLLLASHFCVDLGNAHTEVVAHHAHGEAEPQDGDRAAHPECLLALWGSSDRGPVKPAMETGAYPEPGAAIVVVVMPAERAAPLPPADIGRARSVPLYLLHATFLI